MRPSRARPRMVNGLSFVIFSDEKALQRMIDIMKRIVITPCQCGYKTAQNDRNNDSLHATLAISSSRFLFRRMPA